MADAATEGKITEVVTRRRGAPGIFLLRRTAAGKVLIRLFELWCAGDRSGGREGQGYGSLVTTVPVSTRNRTALMRRLQTKAQDLRISGSVRRVRCCLLRVVSQMPLTTSPAC